MQQPLVCMQQWQTMQLAPNIHRFHIRCQIQRICLALVSIYYKIPIKFCHHNRSAVSHCHTRQIQHHQRRKHHRHDLSADIPDVPHAIAQIVKRPNVLDPPDCIYANETYTRATYLVSSFFVVFLSFLLVN